MRLSLKGEGEELTGVLASTMGTAAIQSGSIAGNQIRLTASLNMGGQSVDLVVTGAIEGDSIRGGITAGTFGTSEFTGSRRR